MAGETSAPRRLRPSADALRFVGFVVLVMAVGALSGPLRSLLPVRVEAELGRTPAFSSALQSLLLGGAGVFAAIGGALADRLGRKRTLVVGLVHLPLMALVYVVQDATALLGAALVSGMVSGFYSVGGQSYLVAAAPRAYLGVASALYFLGSTLGSSLGSLAAGFLIDRGSFETFGASGLVGSIVVIAVAARWLPAAETGAPSSGRGGLVPRVTLSRELLLVAALRFLPTCFWGAATLLVPLLLYRLSGSVLAVSQYSAVSLALAAGCQLVTGRVCDRVGRRWPVLVLGALLPIAALGMGLSAGSYQGLFVAGVLATCVAWSISVLFPQLVRELAPEGEQGQALGLLHLLWTIGMLVGTVAGGWLVQADPGLAFVLGAALNVPTALAAAVLWRRLKPAVA